jgi:hypothetical protein
MGFRLIVVVGFGATTGAKRRLKIDGRDAVIREQFLLLVFSGGRL